jgi:hypothetical protein
MSETMTFARLGVAPVEEKLVKHCLRWFGHIQQRLLEAPICSGVISRIGNGREAEKDQT